tara:strand:+ start:738 stop:1124 length:387 start_codon:yes stop_codon:yes gene_type:complete
MEKLLTISELSLMLDLIDSSNKKPRNYVLRYWEKQFRQIRPKKINNRRYYSPQQVEIVKMIKFLIKNKGMSILGVKNILNSNRFKLDDYNSYSLKADYYKSTFKNKSNKILEKIKKLKKYGKKNTLKS